MYNGIINVYKDVGFTSHDVVAKLRGIFGQRKIGHTGTLDPAATGVLPVCLGTGTKLVDMITDKTKTYEARMLLGTTTDTEDTTGTITGEKEVKLDVQTVITAIESFVGGYMQVPPMYSALKVNGKKLYELAREGKEIERKARFVDINSIKIVKIELPYVTMIVDCGKGTYIRSLCRDIGDKLGCGACMDKLIRTRVGQFLIEDSYTLTQLQQLKEADKLTDCLTPVDVMFADYKEVEVLKEYKKLIDNGNQFPVSAVKQKNNYNSAENVRVYHEGKFYGIYRLDETGKKFVPVKIFADNVGVVN